MTGSRAFVLSLLAAVSAASLAGCDRVFQQAAAPQEAADIEVSEETPATEIATPAASLPEHPEATVAAASIDWDAARRDLAAIPLETREIGFQIASGEAAPPVPVFLPAGDVSIASGENAMRFQQTTDGYFAALPGEKYDVVVNGTNQVIGPADGAAAARDTTYRFLETVSGAQVSFSRYGADYLVEFECKDLPGGKPDCITEDEAVAFSRNLGLTGTR